MNQPSIYDKIVKFFFKIFQPILGRLYSYYNSKETYYTYEGVRCVILPGVFHPRFTFSTKFFVDFIKDLDLKGKQVLELGCGSGLISLHSSAKGAIITASDINPMALDSVNESVKINELKVKTVLSDMFEKLTPQQFDYIFINPPYYPKSPKSVSEGAWFCGEDFEYFQRLFDQLKQVEAAIYMIFSEDCDLKRIMAIAAKYDFYLDQVADRRIYGELNWIFSLRKNLAQN